MSPASRESLWIIVPLLAIWIGCLFLPAGWAPALAVLVALLILFTIYFFRDPDRDIPTDPLAIVAAADGLVTAVDEVESGPYELGRVRRISVFLSVFNVHINRLPFAGVVRQIRHTPGQFLDVRRKESELLNERQDWLLDTSEGTLVVRQIAGLVARRIVAWAREGDRLEKGFRFGMIRFGSRTEIYLPLSCPVAVKVGDEVHGGSSIVAYWKK